MYDVAAMLGCGLGEGLEPALQGFLTFLANTEGSSLLFALVAMCDMVGELVGGPLSASLMAIGRAPGHASEGYCFLLSSVCTPTLLHKAHNW